MYIVSSVTSIGEYAFHACNSLEKVYYHGTAESWAKVSVGSGNTCLENATRYYYSASEPTEQGNYWHYDSNGNVIEW